MESIPGLPDKAKMLIMAGFPTDFGDPARRNPKSPHRQRHSSEKPSPSASEKRNTSRQAKASSSLLQSSKPKNRNRSSTTPSLPTSRLVQASILATLQLAPYQEEKTSEREYSCKAKDTVDEVKGMEEVPTLIVTPAKQNVFEDMDRTAGATVRAAKKIPRQHSETAAVSTKKCCFNRSRW
jgi:hypothetical protein